MTGNINYTLLVLTTAQWSLQERIISGNLFWFCEPNCTWAPRVHLTIHMNYKSNFIVENVHKAPVTKWWPE